MKSLFFLVHAWFWAPAAAVAFCGVLSGVLPDAVQAENLLSSSFVNRENLQSRVDVVFRDLLASSALQFRVPLRENYLFCVDLHEGQYQLDISSHDFTVALPRYKVSVAGDEISAYETILGSASHNASAVVVSETLPLQVQLDGYVEYYESPRGQFTAMLMASPLGAILASTKLTVLAVVCILVMVASTVLSIISPELATELREVQAGAKSRACDIGGKPDGMQSDGVQGGADPAKSSNTNATPILANPATKLTGVTKTAKIARKRK